jgi:hypothetical protein
MQNGHLPIEKQKRGLLNRAPYTGFVTGAIVLVCVLVLLVFHNSLLNTFIKPRIIKIFSDEFPAYSIRIADVDYSILKNRFRFDSVASNALDSTFSGAIGTLSLSGIGCMHILFGGSFVLRDFINTIVNAQDIKLNFLKSHYELRCERLYLSVPDSEMVADTIEMVPLAGDEEFFRESKFRKTRLNCTISRCSVIDLACLELLQGRSYCARSINIHDAVLDVLVNKDKPDSKDTSCPFMPNKILSSLKEVLRIDSLNIMNGQVKYCEEFVSGSEPAFITFDSLQVTAEGIANHGDSSSVLSIHAHGMLANAGRFNVIMTIPVTSPEYSFKYSGLVSRMDLSPLNSFLEVSDQMRIKTGVLQEANFDVNVVSGRASGTLRSVYNDLYLASIDKNTGNENGLSNGFISFVANNFKVRRTNVPNKSGSMKIGAVNYTRQPDDPFIQFAWFALRTGVRDVVGF